MSQYMTLRRVAVAEKKSLVMPLLMSLSCALLVTVIAMRVGVSNRVASILGGAVGAAIAAVAVTRRGR